jgi:hypothetical protein
LAAKEVEVHFQAIMLIFVFHSFKSLKNCHSSSSPKTDFTARQAIFISIPGGAWTGP